MKDLKYQAPLEEDEKSPDQDSGCSLSWFQKARRAFNDAKLTDEQGQRKQLIRYYYSLVVAAVAFTGFTYTFHALAQGLYFQLTFGLVQLLLLVLTFLIIRRVIKAKGIYAVLTFIAGVILFLPLIMGPTLFDYQKEAINWPESGYSTLLPVPPSDFGRIITDEEDGFSADIYKIQKKDYQAYLKECQSLGYTFKAETLGDTYYARNDQELQLILEYEAEKKELFIMLNPVTAFEQLEWPKETLAGLLPPPPSNTGRIFHITPFWIDILVADMSKDAYSAYVEECIRSGFEEILSRDGISFEGFNESGNYLSLHYQIGEHMEVNVLEADESRDWSVPAP